MNAKEKRDKSFLYFEKYGNEAITKWYYKNKVARDKIDVPEIILYEPKRRFPHAGEEEIWCK